MVIPSGTRVVELVVIPKGVHGSGGQVVEAVVEPDVECPSSSPGVSIKQGGVNGGLELPERYWSVQLQTLAGQGAPFVYTDSGKSSKAGPLQVCWP